MLPVPFAAQISESACLPACAQMVLNFLGRGIDQASLMQILGTTDAGTPFSRLRLLEQRGLRINVRRNGEFSEVRNALNSGSPVIVALHAGWILETPVMSQHAVVLIGIRGDEVYALDPAANPQPLCLSENVFMTAWIEMDCIYATIQP